MIDFAYKNAAKLGYEINRIILLLHLSWHFWWGGNEFVVIGAIAVVASYACAYACESMRVSQMDRSEVAGAGAMAFSAAALVLWVAQAV